jgi:hypothetical protein
MSDIKELKWWQRLLLKITSKKLNKMATKATKSTSPNTTWAAVGVLLVTIGGALKVIFDGDPSTTIDFNLILMEVIGFLTAIGLFKAKDSDASHTAQ